MPFFVPFLAALARNGGLLTLRRQGDEGECTVGFASLEKTNDKTTA